MRVCESGGSASISPSLIGFKPRQVLLAQKRNSTIPMGKNKSNVAQLNSEQESILTCSVAMWLDTKGFSKALKRFISSAQIKDQDWKAKGIDLNEVFSKHLANSNEQESILTCSVALWLETKGFSKALKRFISSAQIKDQDWKAKAIDLNEAFSTYLANRNGVQENGSLQEKKESVVVDSSQINREVSGEKAESKKKKKKNKREDAPAENVEVPNAVEKVKKSKTDGKKEKKNKTTDVVGESKVKSELTEKVPDSAVEKKASQKKSIDATEGDEESKKASKKRKRMAVDETEDKPNEEAVQELKAKKSKGAKEGKDDNTQNKEETIAKDIALVSKDEVKNEVEKFSNSKSGRKQNGNYSEPKTVNAFQRVKVDEVVFADERLQDNSYWAKDGADIGYGAKAQEVLGQVRGRNFRHEKTKKKRGSYRGGIIDLQSHSIKFDNSDDE